MAETIHLHGVAVVFPGGGVALLGDPTVTEPVADALVARGARRLGGPDVTVDEWVLVDPDGGDDAVLARVFVLVRGDFSTRRLQPTEAAVELARHALLEEGAEPAAALFRRYAKVVSTTPAVKMAVPEGDVGAAAERVEREIA